MNYRNAFKCRKCPQSNKEDGCPAWINIVMTNDQTGQQKIEEGCSHQLLPLMLIETMRSAEHTTAAAYDMRNKVVEAVQQHMIAQPQPEQRKEIAHE